MPKTMKLIKRTDVIEALKKEKLVSGDFFLKNKKGCRVCAVGAVLRKVSFEKWARKNSCLNFLGELATDGRYVGSDPRDLIADKNYLGALSCYFEYACEGIKGDEEIPELVINRTIAFVRKYFPRQFELTIEFE